MSPLDKDPALRDIAFRKTSNEEINVYSGDKKLDSMSDNFKVEKVEVNKTEIETEYKDDAKTIIKMLDLKNNNENKEVLVLKVSNGSGGFSNFIHFADTAAGQEELVTMLFELSLGYEDVVHTQQNNVLKQTVKDELQKITGLTTYIPGLDTIVQNYDPTDEDLKTLEAELNLIIEKKKTTSKTNDKTEVVNEKTGKQAHEEVEAALLAYENVERNALITQAQSVKASLAQMKNGLQGGTIDPRSNQLNAQQFDTYVKGYYCLAALLVNTHEFRKQSRRNDDKKIKMQSEIGEIAQSIGIPLKKDLDIGAIDFLNPFKYPKISYTLLAKALCDDLKFGKAVTDVMQTYEAKRTGNIQMSDALEFTRRIIKGQADNVKRESYEKLIKEHKNKIKDGTYSGYDMRYVEDGNGNTTLVRIQTTAKQSADGKIVYTNLDGTPFTRAADLQPSERDVLNDRLANTKDPEARMRGITLKLETDQQGKTYPVMSYELNDIDDILLLELYHRTKGNVEAGKEVANAQLLKSLQVELLKRVVTNPSKIDRTLSTLGGEGTESKAAILLGWEEFKNIMGELIFTPDTQKSMNLHYNHLIKKNIEAGVTIDDAAKTKIKMSLFNRYVNQRFVDIAQGSEDYTDRKPNNYATTRNYVAAFSEVEIVDIMGLCTNPPLDKPTDVMTALTEKGLAGEGGALDQLTHAAYQQHPALGKAVAGFASVAKVGLQAAEIGTAFAAGWNAIKTVRHGLGGLVDVVFNDKPFDEKTFEKAINAGKGTLKRGAIHIGLDLVNDPSQHGKVIKVIKEIGGSLGIQPWKDQTEERRILGRKSIDIETDGSAFFKDLFAGISLQEIQQQGIVTYDASGKAVVDVTKLVENPNASAAGTFINANREKQKYIQMANQEFAKELELMGISKDVFERLIKQEPGLTMKELINRRTTRTKLIEEVISDTLTKQGILTREMQNNLYFLPEQKWLEKKRHLSFCIQQIDKLHKPSCLTTYIGGTKATSGATGVGGHTGFVVPTGETDRVQELPKEITDRQGTSASTHLKKLLTEIVEAPDDTTAKAAIKKYFTTLAIVYTGNDPKSNLPLSEDKPDPTNAGQTISKKWRSDDSTDRNNAVNGYFDANSEDLFPSKIPGGHPYSGGYPNGYIDVMPPQGIDNTKIGTILREDAVK